MRTELQLLERRLSKCLVFKGRGFESHLRFDFFSRLILSLSVTKSQTCVCKQVAEGGATFLIFDKTMINCGSTS